MRSGLNMSLVVWDLSTDPYDHSQLANNWDVVDNHDHTAGKGLPIGSNALANSAVTNAKLGPDAVTTSKILNGTILGEDLAAGAIGTNQLDPALIQSLKPLGQVFAIYRPSSAFPLPLGCVVCDGTSYASVNHDFGTGASITVPDLRNKFILGAATSGTGTGTGTPPAENAVGGSQTANLAHSHTLAHTHPVAAHSHTVTSHTHTVFGHVHPVDAHAHAIGADGAHAHSFAGGFGMHTRKNAWITVDGGGFNLEFKDTSNVTRQNALQSLYIAGYNSAAGDSPTWDRQADMDAAGTHSHGGGTGNAAPTAQSNGDAATSAAAPTTSSNALTTDTTGASSGAALGSQDVRPAFVGLLYVVRIRYGA